MDKFSLRNDVISYAEKQYDCKAEYLWRTFPNYAVLRHKENRKWFALFMTVENQKRGGWISVRLDGTVKMEEIKNLLEMSYNLTLPKSRITFGTHR